MIEEQSKGQKIIRELLGFFLIFWGLLVLLSLITYDQNDPAINHAISDPQEIKNSAGLFGAYLSGLLVDIFGVASLLWPAIFIAWGVSCLSTWLLLPWWRWCGFALLATCLISLGAAWNIGLGDVRGGGMLGVSLYQEGNSFFNPLGSILIWLFLLFLSIELAFDIAWFNLIMAIWIKLCIWGKKKMPYLCHISEFLKKIHLPKRHSTHPSPYKTTETQEEVIPLYDVRVDAKPIIDTLDLPTQEPKSAFQSFTRLLRELAQVAKKQPEAMHEPTELATKDTLNLVVEKSDPESDKSFPIIPETEENPSMEPAPDESQQESLTEELPQLSESVAHTEKVAEMPKIKTTSFVLPSINLLQPSKESDALPSTEILEQQSQELMHCLTDFNIQGELIRVTPGPVITLFEIRPAPGVRVGKITNLNDDLARSLRAQAIRIQAPVPGYDTVGIEIPNAVRATVNFRELIQSEAFQNSQSPLSMALGKDTEGRPRVEDLSSMPHILVAGTTGSGKSVCLNSILLSFLLKATPDEVRLMLVDPKRVEMAMYRDMPHLIHPVITEMLMAKNALDWAVHEMEHRYDCLARLGVRNIQDYNKKLAHLEDLTPEQKDLRPMPYLVIVIDELADLMMASGKEVEACLVRLAQLARAAGIHLIVATQRPSVDIVTGILRANFPCRIAFQVSNKYDSRTILDASGAEKLLGKGDMLFKSSGGKIQRLHGPFVSDEEVEAVVKYWKSQCKAKYSIDFSEWKTPTENKGPAFTHSISPEEEALYSEVVTFVKEQGHMSISLLQRRFRIGFNKAARFVERMEEEGILPPSARNNRSRQIRPSS